MADTSIHALPVAINDCNLSYVEHDGKILFSCEEIGRRLGYKNPTNSINLLYRRNSAELRDYSVKIKMISTDGKAYEMRHFTEEGVYIISMLANTPNAIHFRQTLAKLLREIREHKMELAREAGYAQGRQETLCLPVMEAERKKGYLAGLKEGKKLEKSQNGLNALAKIVKYARAGLTYPEIGKIFGISHYAVYRRMRSAKKLGICLQKPEFVQRSLWGAQ